MDVNAHGTVGSLERIFASQRSSNIAIFHFFIVVAAHALSMKTTPFLFLGVLGHATTLI